MHNVHGVIQQLMGLWFLGSCDPQVVFSHYDAKTLAC